MSERACGNCHACCIVLSIPVAPLNKEAGVPCEHLDTLVMIGGEGGRIGCGIYNDRYPVCRDFRCVWLANDDKLVPDHMKTRDDERPDLCGVLIGPASTDSRFFKATGIPLIVAYETRPGGSDTYHSQRLIKRIARRTLVAIMPYDALNRDPRKFVGPAQLVQIAYKFAAQVGGLRGQIQ